MNTTEVQSLRGNPNARRRLRDLKEGAPYPPNHRGASFSSPPGKQPTRDRIRDLRLRRAEAVPTPKEVTSITILYLSKHQKPQDIYTQYSAIDVSPKGLVRRWHVHKNLQI